MILILIERLTVHVRQAVNAAIGIMGRFLANVKSQTSPMISTIPPPPSKPTQEEVDASSLHTNLPDSYATSYLTASRSVMRALSLSSPILLWHTCQMAAMDVISCSSQEALMIATGSLGLWHQCIIWIAYNLMALPICLNGLVPFHPTAAPCSWIQLLGRKLDITSSM